MSRRRSSSQFSALIPASISGVFIDPKQSSVSIFLMKFLCGLLGATLAASVGFAVVVVTVNFSVVYLTKVFGRPSLL